jgi:hypothetical protein
MHYIIRLTNQSMLHVEVITDTNISQLVINGNSLIST